MSAEEEYEDVLFLPKKFMYDDLELKPLARVPGVIAKNFSQFPFLLFMMVNLGDQTLYRCSGSLITNTWVLTAAHCLTASNTTAKDILFLGGGTNVFRYLLTRRNHPFYKDIGDKYGMEEVRVSHYWTHPHFDVGGAPNDVALVKLKKKFKKAKPIRMYLAKVKEVLLNCTLVGWGDDSQSYFDGALRYKTSLMTTTPELGCEDKKEGPYLCLNFDIKHLCVGDAGSPLICNDKIYGIASHYGRLKGIDIFAARCDATAKYYCNSLYYSHNWISAIIREEGSIVLISWQVIFACLILIVFQNF